MTIDEFIQTKSFEMGLPYRVITVSDVQQIIHEALKKQREICAEEYANCDVLGNRYSKIINAPEPEF